MFTLEAAPPTVAEAPRSEETVSSELRKVVAHIRRALRQRAQVVSAGGPSFTGSEVELLRQVRRDPGLRVQDAATALGIAPNSVSTLIRKLTAAGMVERSTDPSDGRVARLHLTPRSQDFLSQMRDLREAAVADALAELDERDRATIAGALPALGRLVEALSAPTESLNAFRAADPPAQPNAGTSQET
jgi:DNA-binding MarR family transcriptional regulator